MKFDFERSVQLLCLDFSPEAELAPVGSGAFQDLPLGMSLV